MEEKTDIELVTQARDGDKNAFGELVLRYQILALNIARHLMCNEDTAHDLVQESMLQALLSLDRLKTPERFKSWLCGIAVNLCRSYIRDRETNLLSLETLTGGQRFTYFPYSEEMTSPIETAEEHEFQNALLRAVTELSSRDREAIIYFYYDQLSMQEIGAISGTTIGSVKVRLFRARKKLKEKLLSGYSEIIPDKERRKMMVKVTITDVFKKEFQNKEGRSYIDYAIVLNDEKGNRVLPIWVGPAEGQAIAMGLTDFEVPRPMTLDFFANLLSAIDVKVEHVRIEALKGDIFYAIVQVICGKIMKEIDCRPSDALALAIRTESPIFACEEVLEQAGIDIRKNANSKGGGLKDIIQEIKSYQSQRRAIGLKLSKEEIEERNKEVVKSVFGGL